MNTPTIRPEKPEDRDAIWQLTKDAFTGRPYAGGDEQDVIDRFRVKQAPHMPRRIVSFDPAITDSEDSDDHGIVALGEDASHPRRASSYIPPLQARSE